MFIAALFIVAPNWKQLVSHCPSTRNKWLSELWHGYAVDDSLAMGKPPPAAASV